MKYFKPPPIKKQKPKPAVKSTPFSRYLKRYRRWKSGAKTRPVFTKKQRQLFYVQKRPKLVFPEVEVAIMKALKNTRVKFEELPPQWIEAYRNEAIDKRKVIIPLALSALAQIEALRKANDNLAHDYHMPYFMDFAKTREIIMKVLAVQTLQSSIGDTLPDNIKNIILETYSESLFANEQISATPYRQTAERAPGESPYSGSRKRSPFTVRSFDPANPSALPVPEYIPPTLPAYPPPASRQTGMVREIGFD